MSIADFDGNKRIMSLHFGVTSFTVSLLYSDWKRWTAGGDNAKFLPAFRYVGGDPTIPGQFLGSTYFITNSWKIRPFNGDHTLIVDGNLFTEDQSSPFLPALDPHMVAVQMAFSNLTTTIVADSTGTVITPDNIATAVWKKSVQDSELDQAGTMGRFVKDIPKSGASEVWNSSTSGSEFITSGTIGSLLTEIPSLTVDGVWSLPSSSDMFSTSGSVGMMVRDISSDAADKVWSKDITDINGVNTIGDFVKNIPTAGANLVWSIPVSAIQFSNDGTIAKFITEVPNITSENVWTTPISGSEFSTTGLVANTIKVLPIATAEATWSTEISGTEFSKKGSIAEFIKNQILTVGKFVGLS